jgi:ATP-binding cassette subfamily B protein
VEGYRSSIGAVFQDYRIYAAKVRENVVMDLPDSGSSDKVLTSLKQSGFVERLETLKDGIDTPPTTEFEEN